LNVDAARVLLYDNQAIIRPDNSYAFSINPHYNLTPQAGSVTFQTLYRASTWWQGIMGDFIFGGNIAGGGTPANYVHFRPDGNLGFGNGSGVESAYLGLDGWGTAGMVSNDFHVRRMYVTYPWGQPGPGYLAQYSAILRSNDLQTVVNAASAALALVAVGGNSSNLRFDCYRSVAGSAWMDTRWRIQSEIDNYGAAGGNLALGYTGSGGMWGLGVGGAYNLYYNPATNQIVAGVFISKAGGGFQIPHPDPAKRSEQRDGGLAVHEEAVDLRHGFVETDTRGDNLYRRVISADEETGGGSYRGRLALPDWWPLINESPQVFVSPRKHFGRAYGEIAADGRSVEISALDPGEYNVLIVGTRSDQQAREWWDATGGAEPRAMTHPDRV
jgi:hypothetical protein